MTATQLLPLEQVDLRDAPVVGAKAARLGWLARQGLPVPTGFVVPTAAFDRAVEQLGLTDRIREIEARARDSVMVLSDRGRTRGAEVPLIPGGGTDVPKPVQPDELRQVRAALRAGPHDATLRREVEQAYVVLRRQGDRVAVRSSAADEDRSDASFAGQHATVLGLESIDDLWQAIGEVWASLFSESALTYRASRRRAADVPSIALIVQRQIDCDVSGTLFTIDPIDGRDIVLVEGARGLGEAVAQGAVVPDRFRVDRDDLRIVEPPGVSENGRPVLDADRLAELALLGLAVEEKAGTPQDVEWGRAAGHWWVFQTRPITGRSSADIDGRARTSTIEWTSGFLDERLVEPVSPLGWSVLRTGLEELAFREPLRMLGVDTLALEPITCLWNGHPYARVEAFAALYKVFPNWLLPPDARRFFPNGDVRRRARARFPRSIVAPEVLRALFRSVARDPLAISPIHNPATWESFERRYRQAMRALSLRVNALEQAERVSLTDALAAIGDVERENRRLLAIHRWSLTLAEVSYALLQRLATSLLGAERAARFCASAVECLDDQSLRLNRALASLRTLARAGRDREYRQALAEFLDEFGHRSFSLDLIRPSFGVDLSQLIPLIQGAEEIPPRKSDNKSGERAVDGWQTRVLAPLAALARRHARLREDQRFAWQRGLALLRRLYLLAGRGLAERGLLDQATDVFFLNADEVRVGALGLVSSLRPRGAARAKRFAAERERFALSPSESYPPFLRGADPLDDSVTFDASRVVDIGPESARDGLGTGSSAPKGVLRGEPVSPGVGRGRARIVVRPDDLATIRPGEVLVARGADPGWTAVFDRLAAVVTESGGQLSHASVVAREYRLPAVVAVPRATRIIRTGDELVVDGTTGVVQLIRD
jgi:pyruvate,water dikinase